MTNQVTVHKHFEMGTAPYRFIGVWSSPSTALAEQNPTAYNNAWAAAPASCNGCCDHCGTGITNHYIMKDAAGNTYSVGSSCIGKIDDVENLSAVEAAKKAHEKKLRKARADKKREEKRLAREAELQAQRDRNNGLTDWELNQKKQKDEREAKLKVKREKYAYFIDALDEGNNFEGDLWYNLTQGVLPHGRGLDIMLEIVAKKAGRKGSKAYDAAYDEAANELEKLTD